MSRLLAALRLASRELRSGELKILIAALVIAVASSTTVSLLADRLTRTMNLQAAEFLAADLAVTGHDAPAREWFSQADAAGLRHAETAEFASVLMSGEQILLAGIKAASDGYPLRGALKTAARVGAQAEQTHAMPRPGQVWVEARVLSALGRTLGDRIEVGEKSLEITRVLVSEPDPRGDLYSLAPRVLMNIDDLEATRIVQPGSHVHYYALFAGGESGVLRFKRWLSPKLHPGLRILDIHEDRPEVGNALKRAQQYLGLTTIGVIVIAGCAIAMSIRRYTERHFDLSAMLKCFGESQRSILSLYTVQFMVIGLTASLLGCFLGWGLQHLAARLLQEMMPGPLAQPSLGALSMGVLTGLLILFGFAVPPLLRLKRCAPLRVLRRDLDPSPSSAWTVYGTAGAVLAWLLTRITGDAPLTATIMAGGLVATAVLALVAAALLRIADLAGNRAGIAWRFALRNLSHNRSVAVAQALTFGVTLIAMLLTVLVRTELLAEWRRQLPPDAPNHFILNLFKEDLPHLDALLEREGLKTSAFYPIVRGRLTAVNGSDVRTRRVADSTADAALNRDLSLTWSATLPGDNRITDGHWWETGDGNAVSVERELAAKLALKLGDRLTFNIAGVDQLAVVTSFRSVRWDTMMPNFFMILSPGSLDPYPQTYLTSFFVPPERKTALALLAKRFPHISLLEVDRILQQFQSILEQISAAIEYLLLFALAAGFTALFAAVRASLDTRLHLNAVCRALGAPRSMIRNSLWLEYAAIGLVAGLLAALAADVIAWMVFARVLHLDAHPHPEFWLLTPLLAALTIGTIGYLSARSSIDKSPIAALRDS